MGGKKACLVIAHYNYTLRFRSCGLFRGTHGFALRTHKALPLTRSGRCPETSLRRFTPKIWSKECPSLCKLRPMASAPENPEQEVTLSLHSPIKALPRYPDNHLYNQSAKAELYEYNS